MEYELRVRRKEEEGRWDRMKEGDSMSMEEEWGKEEEG